MRRYFADRTPPSEEELQHVYDRLAPTWLRGPGRLETWLASDDVRDDVIASLRGDVLELGIGAGETLRRLQHRPHAVTSYIGIDQSPAMVAEAEKASVGVGVETTLQVGHAEDLSAWPDASFDTVTASFVFCTIADVPRALAEVARVCKPDGRLVLLEHVLSPVPIVATIQRTLAPMQIRAIGCHLDRPTPQTVQACGYSIERSRSRRLGVIHLLIARPPAPAAPADSV